MDLKSKLEELYKSKSKLVMVSHSEFKYCKGDVIFLKTDSFTQYMIKALSIEPQGKMYIIQPISDNSNYELMAVHEDSVKGKLFNTIRIEDPTRTFNIRYLNNINSNGKSKK